MITRIARFTSIAGHPAILMPVAAIFAACLTYPNVIAMALLFSMAILLGWSRLHLERHSIFDIVVGAVIGFLAGICFQFLVH